MTRIQNRHLRGDVAQLLEGVVPPPKTSDSQRPCYVDYIFSELAVLFRLHIYRTTTKPRSVTNELCNTFQYLTVLHSATLNTFSGQHAIHQHDTVLHHTTLSFLPYTPQPNFQVVLGRPNCASYLLLILRVLLQHGFQSTV